MRTALLAAGMACLLHADSVVQGPTLGHMVSAAGVRTVLGLPGSSQLTAPVAGRLHKTIALPGRDLAFGVDENGRLVRVNLKNGEEETLDIANVSGLTASPEGDAFLALSEGGAQAFSAGGVRLADYVLPGAPRLIAVADSGKSVAVVVQDADGEALFLLNELGQRRVLAAPKIPALAYLPKSSAVMIADAAGAIYKLDGDLQLTRIAAVPGVKAIAATSDGSRLVAVAGRSVHSVRFDSGAVSSVECSCEGTEARPLGKSNFLLTGPDDGPIWMVNAAGEPLTLAFIPEAVNE